MQVPIQDVGVSRDLALLTANDDAITVKLFRNNIVPTVSNVLGDFTECNFAGYAGQLLVYAGAQIHDVVNHIWYQPCATLTWTMGVPGVTNDVYGCFLVDGAGRLRGAGRLDSAPAPMAVAGQSVSITLNRAMLSEFASS